MLLPETKDDTHAARAQQAPRNFSRVPTREFYSPRARTVVDNGPRSKSPFFFDVAALWALVTCDQCVGAAVQSALFVDFSHGIDIDRRLTENNRALTPGPPRDGEAKGGTFLLEGVSNHTHAEIGAHPWYGRAYDQEIVEKVTLVLKIAVSLIAYGMPAIDAEQTIQDLCGAMRMPKPDLDFSHRKVSARFYETTHVVLCYKVIRFFK